MKVIDPGHHYALSRLDGIGYEDLVFVKRDGEGYPGNVGCYAGTNMQEVIRALIDRVKYLDNQIPDVTNKVAIESLRSALFIFEARAAQRHKRAIPEYSSDLESRPTCTSCGHLGCKGECGKKR